MKEQERQIIVQDANKIWQKLKDELDHKTQTIENIQYYEDFEFVGSGLGEKQIYVVKIENQEIQKQNDKDSKTENSKKTKESEIPKYTTYQIYDKENKLIATVRKDGKIKFDVQYLQNLKKVNPKLYQTLQLEGIDFQLPEELKENDMVLTETDLEENEQKIASTSSKTKKSEKKNEEQKNPESENMEERKEKTAKALGIKPEEIKGLSQINPNEKVTDEYNMRDLIPETKDYDRVEIACATTNSKQGDARFTVLGVKKDGTREVLNSISSVEGVSTSKKVISVNEDGSRVEENSVQGLLRINSRNREDGIAMSLGNYGMLDVSYVRNIMDKETRRSTPLKTLDSENRKEPNQKVRENAGDNRQEVEKEGNIYRENQEKGLDPQSLDGVDTQTNIEFIKQRIIANALEQGEMSSQQLNHFVEQEVGKQAVHLTKEERQNVVNDIKERIIDESRFPMKGQRTSI